MSQSRSSLQGPASVLNNRQSSPFLAYFPAVPMTHWFCHASTPAWEPNCLSTEVSVQLCGCTTYQGVIIRFWVVLMGEEWVFSSLSSPPMPLLLATHLHLVFKLLAPAQRMPCPFRGSEGCCTTTAFLSK